MRKILLLLAVVTLTGCTDSRVKRQASYVNTVTKVAKREFEAAPTNDKKAGVAEKFFKRIPKHTQLLDDYMHGRKPSTPSPKALKQATKYEGPEPAKPRDQ